MMGISTGFKRPDGADIGTPLVEKSYLIDRYPELADTFKQAGLWLWGRNGNGQLGANSTLNKSSPVQTAAGGTTWKLVSCGQDHSVSIKTDGTLWTWGFNYSGQLGDNTTINKSSPVQSISQGTDWKDVSCGRHHTTSIKTDGTLWTWGSNNMGQLGDNSVTRRSSPVQTVAGGTNWRLVISGYYHAMSIKTDGTLWTWGNNLYGQLGTNDSSNRSSPVQTTSGGTNWRLVACGEGHSAAIKTDGTLWMWGNNIYGQLGDGTNVGKSSPVQTISQGTTWKQVGCGNNHAAAVKTDGTLWTWGYNYYGQLGNSSRSNTSSPVQTISPGTNWKQVVARHHFSVAIKTDGTLWTWGINTYGQLGDNTRTSQSSPIQTVSGGTNWKLVSGGLYHTAAIRDDSSDPI